MLTSDKKHIVFLTGTRADFGKLKPLIGILQTESAFEPHIFVTGMHLQQLYGYTLIEVQRTGFKNIHTFENHTCETTMDLTLAKTIEGFSTYVKTLKPDLIVVHGDRVEALAGAIVGSLNNILVAHIEGGELSGTVDELIRHAVSKLSHIHFVANDEAKKRLIQMGELEQSIFEIGSPDMDVMFSQQLPELDQVKAYYQIPFNKYALAMFHPVTTEIDAMATYAEQFVTALMASQRPYVVIYPNNDLGSSLILKAYERLKNQPNFKLFPSIRFEYFLTLLKHADFIIGNSSAGVREAPAYGVPTINVGSRQQNRSLNAQIINTDYNHEQLMAAITAVKKEGLDSYHYFGNGNSAKMFLNAIGSPELWNINQQKQFNDRH